MARFTKSENESSILEFLWWRSIVVAVLLAGMFIFSIYMLNVAASEIQNFVWMDAQTGEIRKPILHIGFPLLVLSSLSEFLTWLAAVILTTARTVVFICKLLKLDALDT